MNNDIYEQDDKTIPKPFDILLGYIVAALLLLICGFVCFFAPFDPNGVAKSPALLIICGIVTFIPGVFFLIKVFQQIKLRLTWNKRKKMDSEEIERVTGAYEMEKYLREKYGKDFVPNLDDSLVKDKYGNIYAKSKLLNGDLAYFVISLFLLIFLVIGVVDLLQFIKEKDVMNIVVFMLLMVFISIFEIYFIASFIREFREKRQRKRLIKEGVIPREKIDIGALLHRILIYLFVAYMGFLSIGLLFQEKGIELPGNIMQLVFFIFALIFIVAIIYQIYNRFSILKKIFKYFHK